jgi:hypothetical protein
VASLVGVGKDRYLTVRAGSLGQRSGLDSQQLMKQRSNHRGVVVNLESSCDELFEVVAQLSQKGAEL